MNYTDEIEVEKFESESKQDKAPNNKFYEVTEKFINEILKFYNSFGFSPSIILDTWHDSIYIDDDKMKLDPVERKITTSFLYKKEKNFKDKVLIFKSKQKIKEQFSQTAIENLMKAVYNYANSFSYKVDDGHGIAHSVNSSKRESVKYITMRLSVDNEDNSDGDFDFRHIFFVIETNACSFMLFSIPIHKKIVKYILNLFNLPDWEYIKEEALMANLGYYYNNKFYLAKLENF